MSNPRIYYYPDGSAGTLETIDFGEGLSSIDCQPGSDRVDAIVADGSPYTSILGASSDVRIVLERFGPAGASALERQLQTLEAHLLAGGFIGFSRDHAKTWAAIASTGITPSRGDTTFYTGGNGFTSWNPAGALASGDELVIEGGAPSWRREITTAAADVIFTASSVSLTDALRYTYTDDLFAGQPVLRWRDFYPVLWLPADGCRKPRITHDRRMNFSIELQLRYDWAAVAALWEGDAYQVCGADGALHLPDGSGLGGGLWSSHRAMSIDPLGSFRGSKAPAYTSPRIVR